MKCTNLLALVLLVAAMVSLGAARPGIHGGKWVRIYVFQNTVNTMTRHFAKKDLMLENV